MEATGPKLAGISRQSKFSTERRHTVRHRAHTPAYATLNESQANTPDLSEILDISEDGMSIQTSSPLQVKDDLSLSLDLSETGTRIRTDAQVIWSDSSGRAGFRFAKLPKSSLHQLKEWLFVNVLTAFDHSRATSVGADGRNNTSNGLLPSHSMAKGEVISATLENSQNRNEGPEAEREEAVELNALDRESTLQLTAERALVLTRATGAAIALSEGDDSEMVCRASAGSDAPPVGTRLHVGSGFSGECVRTGRSLRCDDSDTDDRVDREGCRTLGIRSMVAVPIRPGSKVAGLLEVFSPQPYAFNANDISALQHLTGSILSTLVPATAARPSTAPVQRTLPRPLPTKTEDWKAEDTKTEEQPAARVTAAIPARAVAALRSSRPRLWHKALLVAALATFVLAVLWLIAPWISGTLHSSGRAPVHAQAAQAPSSKSSSVPANVTDLASLRKVAERGDPAAQFALGARYATGEEVKQDYAEAVKWFTLAAEQGHILAQATLGAYYWAGRGVPQDLNKAYYWSVLAQAGGDQASKYRVAVLASRMSRSQVLAAQEQANEWLSNFAARAPSSR
ncbi:MAG: GAF domain-containing protein [Terriglobales bacterium]